MQSNGVQALDMGWKNLGVGPLTVSVVSCGSPIVLIVSDSAPAPDALGMLLDQSGRHARRSQIGNSQAVWARATDALGATVDVLIGTPAAGAGGGGASALADGADIAGGATAQAPAGWFTAVASRIQLLKLLIAAIVGAGSHNYGYDANSRLISDSWTLFGVTRTKNYSYTAAGLLDSETDWI